MLSGGVYNFRNYLRDNGIMFCYSGYMTEDILSGIGDALRKRMSIGVADSQTGRAVFSVFVEEMQNVIRYSAELEKRDQPPDIEMRYGVVTVALQDGYFVVTCGNKIKNEDVETLKGSLELIQSLDAQGLKDLYRSTLKSAPPKGSKGAGVGFIDIARRTSKPIWFDFEDVGDGYNFFTFKAFV